MAAGVRRGGAGPRAGSGAGAGAGGAPGPAAPARGDPSAVAEGLRSFQAYFKPVQLYNELDIRRRRCPTFLARTLRYRQARRGELSKQVPGARVQVALSSAIAAMGTHSSPSAGISAIVAVGVPCGGRPNQWHVLGARIVRLGGAPEDPVKREVVFHLPNTLLQESERQVGVSGRDFSLAARPASSQQRSPALHVIAMVWKDHQDLGVFQGRAERALGREGGRAAGGLASRVFGLIPGGAEVAWQALKVREPDSPGQAVHSSLGGVMRKGMVRNIPGGLCRLQIDDREPSTSQLESSASPLTQGRYAAGASEAEISLGVDVSATLNGLVDFTKFQTCFQIQYHYWFANNTMKKTEIAENYSCPFCVQRHPSFEALKCHLLLCHDLFHYSFHGRGGIGSSVNLTTDPLVHDKEGRLMLPEAEVYRANNINKEFFFFRGREKKVRGVPAPVTIRDVERYKYELAYVRKRRSAPAAPTNEVGADRGKRKIRFLEEDEVVGRKRKVQRLQQRSNNGVGGGERLRRRCREGRISW